ncbi:ribosome assembly protein-like protein Noc2 [Lepidopterella palustris CBS 459.81]|uniref:Ribosome assembly protein-like protein Noc2 n=1 Tax=Lepidopterella palustris CBS 459.81 TaxID=1314670 RepID=A0A8E2EK81_9PEZI|nr:ribosome assembly protein-like protein Noc2 [Lepidopterella palustris CBS 459.81]
MAQSKATRKFEKNHLKDEIKRRKEFAKVKQKQQIKAKRKERRAKDNERADDLEQPDDKNKAAKGERDGNPFGDMSVDDFFQGGFDIPEKPKKKAKKPNVNSIPPMTGKRKRSQPEAESTSLSDEPLEQNSTVDLSHSEAESEDGFDTHKEQLAALASKDPEFYKYLQDNDAELLDFEDVDFAEIDALSDNEDEETPRKKQKKSKQSRKLEDELEDGDQQDSNEVTKAMTKKWSSAMVSGYSLRATKEVALAFRAAAHLNEDDGKEYKYSISDSDVYHELLIIALQHIPKVLQQHLPVKETVTGKIRVATDSKKYRTLTPLLKSHTTSVHHLLENLSDAATLRLTLDSLLSLLPYILSFKKLVRDVARTVVGVWADSSNKEITRVAAFLVLRKLVVIGDPSIKEAVLKATYQGLVKGARSTTVHTIQGVNLMKNTAAELWGLDPNIGYTTGFTFIRQLAIHLRSAITNKSKESYKTVYNWQYVHSLDFWSRVVSAHCESLREVESGHESPLRPLIYPLVQVTIGAMRLIPTAQYFPLRFQLTRSLLRISLATSTYIPLAPALYEVLNSAEMKKPAKPSTLKALDFSTSIRAAKSYLRTRVYQDGVGEQVVELLSEFFVLWAKNIAFPELALPLLVMLKRWIKEMSKKSSGNKNHKVNSMVTLLAQKLEVNSAWVEEKRRKVDFAPNNRAGVESFLKDVELEKSPLGAFVIGQRKAREQKASLLEEGRKEEERKRQEAREEAEKEAAGDFGESSSQEENGEEN